MRYVLGIDQGGSKTHAIIADENGRILGMGKSYGACHSYSGLEAAMGAIREASDSAIQQSGLKREDVSVVVAGLTGVDWDYETALLENAVKRIFLQAEIRVVNDCIIAMKAATKKEQCGILCAGSGLNCAVQNGEECFVYGFYIQDEYQGGSCLGRKAVQAVFDSYMGLVEETELTGILLEHFQVQSVDELLYMHVNEKISSEEYLKLPVILERAACNGDVVAGKIWTEFGENIARYLTVRMCKMGIQEECIDVVLSGSIFKCKYEKFQQSVKDKILSEVPKANIIEARYEPVMGAVIMGIREIQGELSEEYYSNLEISSRNYPVWRR